MLSRPYILASDNQQATVTVGQVVPYISESRLDENDNTINTVTYADVGIILTVIPHINPDGLVTLQVEPQISDEASTSIAISNGVTSPVFDLRSAQTYVAVQDGQTIVIGGLMQDEKQSTITKVPILGSLPFIGTLFQRNDVTKTKTELLIFMTPHVAKQAGLLKGMGQDEMKGLKLTPSAVTPGIFDEHLRGLQRGATQPSSDVQSPYDSASAPGKPTRPEGTLTVARPPSTKRPADRRSLRTARAPMLAVLVLVGIGCHNHTTSYQNAGGAPLAGLPPASAAGPRLTTDQVVGSDPCAVQLQNVEGVLLQYFALNHQLPPTLQDLIPLADADQPLSLVCPETHQPYAYLPAGLSAANQAKRIIVYDAAPHRSGTRWCILMPPLTHAHPGSLSMEVVALPEAAFRQFYPPD